MDDLKMDKLKMAHEWFITSINNGKHVTIEQAWCYADAMQAEADEREKEIKHNHLKTYADAYMNCEIQVTDPDGNCRITTRQKELDRKEWQPDWSEAPTNELEELNYWCMDESGDPWWFSLKPRAKYGQWNSKNEAGLAIKAPSFNYNGNWQDSLRKRPSNI